MKHNTAPTYTLFHWFKCIPELLRLKNFVANCQNQNLQNDIIHRIRKQEEYTVYGKRPANI